MQHEGHVHQRFDRLEAGNVEVRRGEICAMLGADADREAVHARAADKLLRFVGIGLRAFRPFDDEVALFADQLAEFAFHADAEGMRIFHNPLGQRDVLFKRQRGAVDHHGRVSRVDRLNALFVRSAVIEVQRDGYERVCGCALDGFDRTGESAHQVAAVGARDKDNRNVEFRAGFNCGECGIIRNGDIRAVGDAFFFREV